jgi:hypothetical protein
MFLLGFRLSYSDTQSEAQYLQDADLAQADRSRLPQSSWRGLDKVELHSSKQKAAIRKTKPKKTKKKRILQQATEDHFTH